MLGTVHKSQQELNFHRTSRSGCSVVHPGAHVCYSRATFPFSPAQQEEKRKETHQEKEERKEGRAGFRAGIGDREARTVVGEQPQQGSRVQAPAQCFPHPHSCQQGGMCRKAGPCPHPTTPHPTPGSTRSRGTRQGTSGTQAAHSNQKSRTLRSQAWISVCGTVNSVTGLSSGEHSRDLWGPSQVSTGGPVGRHSTPAFPPPDTHHQRCSHRSTGHSSGARLLRVHCPEAVSQNPSTALGPGSGPRPLSLKRQKNSSNIAHHLQRCQDPGPGRPVTLIVPPRGWGSLAGHSPLQ